MHICARNARRRVLYPIGKILDDYDGCMRVQNARKTPETLVATKRGRANSGSFFQNQQRGVKSTLHALPLITI